VLRVATPVTFGAREIAPGLGAFLDTHPALRVELLMADRRVDLLDEGIDVAIRLGALEDSSFVSRRLASAPRYLVASADYVRRRGAPGTPAELAEHDVVLQAPGTVVWTLRGADGAETALRPGARLVVTATEGLIAAAVAGLGIAALSAFACRAELARGDLVRVLPEHMLAPVDVHAVFPAGRRTPVKARAFADHLARQLG
jgi:DNA-binding transcriptional LysR family regulator